jgi:hypothetical protein
MSRQDTRSTLDRPEPNLADLFGVQTLGVLEVGDLEFARQSEIVTVTRCAERDPSFPHAVLGEWIDHSS